VDPASTACLLRGVQRSSSPSVSATFLVPAVFTLLFASCAPPSEPKVADSSSPSSEPTREDAPNEAGPESDATNAAQPAEERTGVSGDAGSAEQTGTTSQAPVGPPLPEVKVEAVGLHIGGGPNDDATRAPFKSAISPHHGALLACYRKVEKPGATGTFGVDLFIPRSGGHPDVRQPRTAIRGEEFRDCVVEVFRNVEFEKPKRGPTIISYSVKFSVSE
jgi:hypothetical protein